MKKTYEELLCDNNKLRKELDDLKHEYQENTIIQSMNDMKRRYDKLLDTTVPIDQYKRIEAKNLVYEKKITAAEIFIDRITRNLKETEKAIIQQYGEDNNVSIHFQIYKIQLQIMFLKEILEVL